MRFIAIPCLLGPAAACGHKTQPAHDCPDKNHTYFPASPSITNAAPVFVRMRIRPAPQGVSLCFEAVILAGSSRIQVGSSSRPALTWLCPPEVIQQCGPVF